MRKRADLLSDSLNQFCMRMFEVRGLKDKVTNLLEVGGKTQK